MITREEYEDVRGLLAPWKLYGGIPNYRVTPDDLLVAAVRNSLAGVTLNLRGRLWTDDGAVKELDFPLVPGTTRALQFFGFQLEHGFLVSAALTPSVGAPHRGQTLGSIYLVRPPVASFLAKYLLAQDYVTAQYGPTWPFGRHAAGAEGQGFLYTVSVPNPSPGVDWTQAVPTGARWLVHGVLATLATSVAPANRQPALQMGASGNVTISEISVNTQAASLTQAWRWIPGYPSTGVAQQGNQTHALPFPVLLRPGDLIQTLTLFLDISDQWSGIRLLVEEWLED